MADIRHFSGEDRLQGNILSMPNAEFAACFPGVIGQRSDSFSRMVMRDATGVLRSVDRRIEFKPRPSLHECDARCFNATGKTMKCECACGGKNHGRGSFVCEVA